MDRTTSTARAVLSLTVWALAGLAASGCVTVEPPPAPPAGGSRPEPTADSLIVQGPAREALRAAPDESGGTPSPAPPPPGGPPPPPGPPLTAAAERIRPAAPVTTDAPAPATASLPAPRPRRAPTPPRVGVPPDVCGLSEVYGGWRPESTQSQICRRVYGRITGR
ncbi:hypothetical protein [Streptomyces yaizuensis]|uniref:Lipoprotein n=1 Tax=Streptomyces yaizuensis TaxID=2989713 RepID=A0ABQ5P0H6_9ACTN|nr:hypothetical protein [Streptomyces sp. YSPA8]GLF95721.1 lipoprotein [Streptomyces sp. YSPA8]